MIYHSTRNNNLSVSSAEAIAQGISADGGLFVPASIPELSAADFDALKGLSYAERAARLFALYLTDFTDEELRDCTRKAYESGSFETPNVQEISTLADGTMLLELWHGPTCAFKDMALGRDDYGCSRLEHNGSLTRFFEQVVYIPSGTEGKYPYGYTVKNGSKFCDLRPMYEDLDKYQELKAAWEKDVAAGAVYDDKTSDTSDFENVAAVDLNYHRFWHAGDILMGMGAMYELYPDVKPFVDGATDPGSDPGDDPGQSSASLYGDVDCDGKVKISDVVLLSRFVNEEAVTIKSEGKKNAEVTGDGELSAEDVTAILKYIARLITKFAVEK